MTVGFTSVLPPRLARAVALTVVALAAPAVARAQGFSYAPGTASYTLTSRTQVTQEAQGQKQESQFSSVQRVTLALARGRADTMSVSLTIDSINVQHSVMGTVDVSRLKGVKLSATMSPKGALYHVAPNGSIDPATADQMVRILPHVRGRLAVGATWTDTLAGPVAQGGLTLNRSIITTSKVIGDTVVNGEKGWRIGRSAVVTLSGRGTPQGQPVAIQGSGTGKGTYVVSARGVLLGADLVDELRSTVSLANGMEIVSSTKSTSNVVKHK